MAVNELQNKTGGRMRFLETGAQTGGKRLAMEAKYPPRSAQPPNHYHPYQEEQFEVLQGRFRTSLNGIEYIYETGDSFTVPANTPHWMHNISDVEGMLLWKVQPALKTQAFLETMWGLEADGKTDANGRPNLWQLAVIMRAYAAEFRVTSPPYAMQRVLFGILAPLGRLLGYRARYPQYSGANL